MFSAGVTASLKGGALTVYTGSNAPELNVVEDHGTVLVENILAGTSSTFSGVTSIAVNGQAQGDMIFYTGNTIGAVIHANGGNDTVTVADIGTGHSYANGDGNDDNLTILVANHTTVVGGGGNDLIYLNTGISNYTVAAENVDFVSYAYGDGGGDTFTTYGGTNYIYGGGGGDTAIDLGGTNTYNSVETVVTI
jgi:hypothetical protein